MALKSIGRPLYLVFVKAFSGFGLYRYPWIRRINKLILRRIKVDQVRVNNMTLFLDKGDSLNLSVNPHYEPEETAFVQRTIRTKQCVIDIGANIGYYTTLFAQLVGPEGKVFSFEPDPDNHHVLIRNVQANRLSQVEVNQAAVSDMSGTIRLFYSGDKGDQRIYDSKDGRASREVKCVSLDDYFRDLSRPIDFIKMDVQGAEGKVLLGMRNLLKRNPNVIVSVEFWPFGLEKSEFGTQKLLDLLDELQLEFYDMNRPEVTNKNKEELIRLYPASTKSFTNLICSVRKPL